jgi:tetratricopeptide (TPR) repeat protein
VAVTGVSLTLANRASAERTRAVAAAAAEADLRRRAEESAGEEKKARLEAEGLAAMLDSLVASVKSGQGAIDGLRKQLDQTAAALTADTGDPLIRARLLYTVAITRRNIGDYAEAVPLMERSLALRTEHLGGAHPLTRETAGEMGYTYVHVRRGEDAVRVLQPLADAGPAEDSVDALPVLHRLRIAYHAAGRTDEAAALGERILAFCVRHYGEDHEETEWMRLQLPRYTGPDRQFDEALPVLRKAYDKLLGTWGPTAVPFIVARAELGRCLFDAGRPEEALPYLKEMYEATVSRSGPNHPITLSNANDLARAYEACGRPADAIPLRRTLRDHYRAAGDAARADYQAARLAEAEAAVESGR